MGKDYYSKEKRSEYNKHYYLRHKGLRADSWSKEKRAEYNRAYKQKRKAHSSAVPSNRGA